MNQLYPIVRRVRRPLIIQDDGAAPPPPATPQVQQIPVEAGNAKTRGEGDKVKRATGEAKR